MSGFQDQAEIVRAVLLVLRRLQRSPPEPVLLLPHEIAVQVGCHPTAVRDAIETLIRLELIDGPGIYGPGWLFRRLTPSGATAADELASGRRWKAIKRRYETDMDR